MPKKKKGKNKKENKKSQNTATHPAVTGAHISASISTEIESYPDGTPEAIFCQAEALFIDGEQKQAVALIAEHAQENMLTIYHGLLLTFRPSSAFEIMQKTIQLLKGDALELWIKQLTLEQQASSIYLFAYGVFLHIANFSAEGSTINSKLAELSDVFFGKLKCCQKHWRMEYVETLFNLSILRVNAEQSPLLRKKMMSTAYESLSQLIERQYPPAHLMLGNIYADNLWKHLLNRVVEKGNEKQKEDRTLSDNKIVLHHWSIAISKGVIPSSQQLECFLNVLLSKKMYDLMHDLFNKIEPWDEYGCILLKYISGKCMLNRNLLKSCQPLLMRYLEKEKLDGNLKEIIITMLSPLEAATVFSENRAHELKRGFEETRELVPKIMLGHTILREVLPQLTQPNLDNRLRDLTTVLIKSCLDYFLAEIKSPERFCISMCMEYLSLIGKARLQLKYPPLEEDLACYYQKFLSRASALGNQDATLLLMFFCNRNEPDYKKEKLLFNLAKEQASRSNSQNSSYDRNRAQKFEKILRFSSYDEYLQSLQIANLDNCKEIICYLFKPQLYDKQLQSIAKEIKRISPTALSSDSETTAAMLLSAYFNLYCPNLFLKHCSEYNFNAAILRGLVMGELPLACALLSQALDKVIELKPDSGKILNSMMKIAFFDELKGTFAQDIIQDLARLLIVRIDAQNKQLFNDIDDKQLLKELKGPMEKKLQELFGSISEEQQYIKLRKIEITKQEGMAKEAIRLKLDAFLIKQGYVPSVFHQLAKGSDYVDGIELIPCFVNTVNPEDIKVVEQLRPVSLFFLFEKALYLATCLGVDEALAHWRDGEKDEPGKIWPVDLCFKDAFVLEQLVEILEHKVANITVNAYVKDRLLFETCQTARLTDVLYLLSAIQDVEHPDMIFNQKVELNYQKGIYQITVMPNLRSIYSRYFQQIINKEKLTLLETARASLINKKESHEKVASTVSDINEALSGTLKCQGVLVLTVNKTFELVFARAQITDVGRSNLDKLRRGQYKGYFNVEQNQIVVKLESLMLQPRTAASFIESITALNSDRTEVPLLDPKKKKQREFNSGLEQFAAILDRYYLRDIKSSLELKDENIKCTVDLAAYQLTLDFDENKEYILFGKSASSIEIISFLQEQINSLRQLGCQIPQNISLSAHSLALTMSRDEFDAWENCQWPVNMPGVQDQWGLFYRQQQQALSKEQQTKQKRQEQEEQNEKKSLWKEKRSEEQKGKEAKKEEELETILAPTLFYHKQNKPKCEQKSERKIIVAADAFYRTAQEYWQKIMVASAQPSSDIQKQSCCEAIQTMFVYLMFTIVELEKTSINCKERRNFARVFGAVELQDIKNDISRIRASTKSLILFEDMRINTCAQVLTQQFVLPDYNSIFSDRDYRPAVPVCLSIVFDACFADAPSSSQLTQGINVSEELPIILQVMLGLLQQLEEKAGTSGVDATHIEPAALHDTTAKISQILHCYQLIQQQSKVKQCIGTEQRTFLKQIRNNIRNIHFHEKIYTDLDEAQAQQVALFDDVKLFLEQLPSLSKIFSNILSSITDSSEDYAFFNSRGPDSSSSSSSSSSNLPPVCAPSSSSFMQ